MNAARTPSFDDGVAAIHGDISPSRQRLAGHLLVETPSLASRLYWQSLVPRAIMPTRRQRSPLETSSYPSGWFHVADSAEIAPGTVHRVTLCGREIVLFRSSTGAAYCLDAHCPHMGSHLGYGGIVEGEGIKCPFHHHVYDGKTGACVQMPRPLKIPPADRAETRPLAEHDGMIFVHHHPLNRPPQTLAPSALDWYHDDRWTDFQIFMDVAIEANIQDIAENFVDQDHFRPVHNVTIDRISVGKRPSPTEVSFTVGRGHETHYELIFYGLGYLKTIMEGEVRTRTITTFTPLDLRNLRAIGRLSCQRLGHHDVVLEKYQSMLGEHLKDLFLQDATIWKNKIYRARPAYCASDQPIIQLRRYARQFYRDDGAP